MDTYTWLDSPGVIDYGSKLFIDNETRGGTYGN